MAGSSTAGAACSMQLPGAQPSQQGQQQEGRPQQHEGQQQHQNEEAATGCDAEGLRTGAEVSKACSLQQLLQQVKAAARQPRRQQQQQQPTAQQQQEQPPPAAARPAPAGAAASSSSSPRVSPAPSSRAALGKPQTSPRPQPVSPTLDSKQQQQQQGGGVGARSPRGRLTHGLPPPALVLQQQLQEQGVIVSEQAATIKELKAVISGLCV